MVNEPHYHSDVDFTLFFDFNICISFSFIFQIISRLSLSYQHALYIIFKMHLPSVLIASFVLTAAASNTKRGAHVVRFYSSPPFDFEICFVFILI